MVYKGQNQLEDLPSKQCQGTQGKGQMAVDNIDGRKLSRSEGRQYWRSRVKAKFSTKLDHSGT